MTISIYSPVKLGEILRKSGEWIDIRPDQQYRQVTIKMWGQGVVLRNEVAGAEIAAARRFVVRPQQFILSRIDARNGALGIVPPSLDGAVVSNDFPTFNLDTSCVLPEYLGWMSKTHDFVELCKAASEGTTNRVRLQEDRFLALQIPLPPLAEQRRIVARIEELAAKIAEARGLRREAVEEANAWVSSLHLSLAQGRTLQLNQMVVLDECREPVEPERQYPQVGVKGFGQGLFPKEAVNASETTYKAFNRLYDGALVLSQVKGWEGAIAVCDKELAGWYVSPEYRTFRCIPNQAVPEYMAALVATPWFWGQLKHMSKGLGGRRERTRPEQFLQMELPMPSVEQQHQAIKVFQWLNEVKRLQAETAAELDALLPAVLDKAFKGEL
jgi:type I restriction enzyme S subunit